MRDVLVMRSFQIGGVIYINDMTLSQVKSKIFENLIDPFKKEGFRHVISKDTFEKKTIDFTFVYKLLFHSRTSEIAIELFALIEHNETERIYKAATNHVIFETIGNEIGKLIYNTNGKINNDNSIDLMIREEFDIKITIDLIKKYFNDVALPYFKNNCSLNKIDEILNSKPEEVSVHANAQYFRCPKGLIVAKLNNRSNYKELEEKYDKKMEAMNELAKQRYLKVKAYLNLI